MPLSKAAAVAASLGILVLAALRAFTPPQQPALIADPSFEETKARDQFGRVFAKWGGWNHDAGTCSFEAGAVAHSGKTSALLACGSAGKIRISQEQDLPAGRYRVSAYLRGVDIGTGQWNQTTEFMFNGKYINLSKNGSFGWSRLTYVAELPQGAHTGPSFGLFAPGMLWIDDVSLEQVGTDVRLTDKPVIEAEEAPIEPPASAAAGATRCSRCQRRNLPEWGKCYACGTALGDPHQTAAQGSAVKTIGPKTQRLEKGAAVMDGAQDWSGYDFLKVDTNTDSEQPVPLTVEIRDSGTTGYWTRVNYPTVIAPGRSTLALPLQQLYVGEKSRPGRHLLVKEIRRLVFELGDGVGHPVSFDNIRLERDASTAAVSFEELRAFDFGPGGSPVMDGFLPITPATFYDPGRGYGLHNAKIWRAVDALQPDPLYQDFLSIESGGLAVDVPNGQYRVFVNMDSPNGYWGELQTYRQRSIVAQGKTVISESMNLKSFQKKYFQFWDRDDLPTDNTFDKYDRAHFSEKVFDVNVTNGRLEVDFAGENWACSVSAVVVFPVAKAAEGARFLEWVRNKRRFYFDNAFKRVLHRPSGDPLQPSAEETARGHLLFPRDPMEDLYYNDTPRKGESGQPLTGDGFPGEAEAVTLGVTPLRDLGRGKLTASALAGPAGTIPASAIEIGYVSYRISRVTGDGSVYQITPRLVIPRNTVEMPAGITRQFWMTVHIPESAGAGLYEGRATFTPEKGAPAAVPLRFRVRKGALAQADIPIGPFGGSVGVPWIENDPETARLQGAFTEKSLRTLRDWKFTMFSGVPWIVYRGFEFGKPALDFSAADAQMRTVKSMGFLAVSSYGAGVKGLNGYQRDLDKMKAAGYSDYSEFLKAVYSAIQAHARAKDWPAVYWNLGDEPLGAEALKSATENAKAYRTAFPAGPPWFTAATSLYEPDPEDLHFHFAEALHAPALNRHSETAIQRLRAAGGQWAFYNSGSRWTFGEYLYKAVSEFGLRFRIAWHWNNTAGDPYYALDCREDDYAWATAAPDEQLILSLEFFRIAAGLNDYRYLLTLEKLAGQRPETPQARAAKELITRRLAAFRLGDIDRSPAPRDWKQLREETANQIEALAR
jgi:hypothetical protein